MKRRKIALDLSAHIGSQSSTVSVIESFTRFFYLLRCIKQMSSGFIFMIFRVTDELDTLPRILGCRKGKHRFGEKYLCLNHQIPSLSS